jgi:1A family penicillin-binding protein
MAQWRDSVRERRRRRRLSTGYSQTSRNKRLAKLAKIAFVGVLVAALASFVAIPLLSLALPSPDKIVRREGFSTKILDRNGQVLYDIFVDQRRTPVEDISQIPDYLKQATIAIEDRNFYEHQGFDPTGYARALYNIVFKRRLQGGSTLTQQLVKNVLLTSERTIIRKLKELVLTLQIEQRYSKDDILLLYLNEVPYGGTAYGVEAAAETYFGKKVTDLNLVESVILAGLPQSPSRYSPYSSTPDAYVDRAKQVLRRMREDGYITLDQEEESVRILPDVEFQPRGASFKAPHFVQYVQETLEERYGASAVEQGGLVITTTLDLELQEEAQKIVSEEIAKVENLNIGNGAAVVVNPETGEILAMVGSKDFAAEDYDGQVNVTTRPRQPGSAIKPITYTTALKEGYTASSLLMDVPTVFPGGIGQPDYEPKNYDGAYRGPVQMRYALANSINVPAVKMLALVGIRDALQTAYDLGINTLEPTGETLSRVGLSLTLGGGEVKLLELAGAYGAFVNEGHRVEPVAILKIEDHDGSILEEVKPEKGRQVITPEQAFIVADILSDNVARSDVFGPNSLLNIPGKQVAVKTGTTNDQRDNWSVGGNANAIVGAWVGNNDNSGMKSVASGISGATPIWRRIILEALEGKPDVSFTPPDGVVKVNVDAFSGFTAHDGFAEREEYFIKGTEPGEDQVHVNLEVCRGTPGRLASPPDIARGSFDLAEYYVFDVADPTSSPGGVNRWMEGINAWVETQADPRYHPPTEYCSSGNSAPINIDFLEPKDTDSDLGSEVKVRFVIDFIHEVKDAWLEVDGVRVRTFTAPPYEHTLNLSKGVHKLRAAAKDSEGNESERIIIIGVGTAWDEE